MSFDQKNQFMNQSSHSNGPQFQQFLKTCYQSPQFFQFMKKSYLNNVEQHSMQNSSLNVSSSFSQHNNSNVHSKVQQRQYQNQEQEVYVPNKNRDMKKKPANPLSKFIPSQKNKPQPQPVQKPQHKVQAYDQMPIKSNYIESMAGQNFDLNTMKENKSINIENTSRGINFDDMPIRGAKQYQQDSYYAEQKEESYNYNNSSSFVNQDERPLTGCNKDFKQMLKEQFPNAIVNEEEDRQQKEEEKRSLPRNFLKRGSRQHLSSALNRSKQPKNKDNSMTKSQLDDQRSITPRKNQPQGRSTSQNRVLAKKGNMQSQKVIPKSTMNNKNDESFDDATTRAKPPLYKPSAKVEPRSVKALDRSQSKMSPNNVQKKKTKNVFRDESEESSDDSEQQEHAPYFKSTKKQQYNQTLPSKAMKTQPQDLIQPIEGVYMTQEQLNAIISRYSKQKVVVKQAPESQKFKALRQKYNEMIRLVEEQSQQNKLSLEKQREEFQKYKSDQMAKLKNDRRVMERQVKSAAGSHNSQKDKEQIQHLRNQLQKQKEDYKRKDKSSKIMIEKYKKENEQLKNKLQRLENQLASKPTYARRDENDDKVSTTKSSKAKKLEEDIKVEQISYRDIKKGAKVEDNKSTKPKYQYVEDELVGKNNMGKTAPAFKKQNKWKVQQDSESEPSEQEQVVSDQDYTDYKNNHQGSRLTKLSDLMKPDLSIKEVTNQTIQQLFRHQNNPQFNKYLQSLGNINRKVVNTNRNNRSDYTAKLYSDRSKELVYDNGTRKVALENGYSIVYFKNGDIKQTLPDKTVLYYFKQKEVDQITLPNGVNIYRFENNQVEFHFENGYIEIRHADGTIKILGGDHLRR